MTKIPYLRYLNVLSLFNTKRTRAILSVNPTVVPVREEARTIRIFAYNYSQTNLEERELQTVEDCFPFKDNQHISWINIDGIRKHDVETICQHFGVHALTVEDIMSIGQRPKMEAIGDVLYCLLNMLYFNQQKSTVEVEQISIILGKDFVISFQEDPDRDVFNGLRDRLRVPTSRHRQLGADYLCYTMLDMIVDHYFIVMDQLGERIEQLEEKIVRSSNKRSLAEINALRKELIVLKRNIQPVRDLINGLIRSESELLEEKTTKYFRDVYDHIVQASELVDSYRDMMINLQDLYLSNVNLKMNEVMKVMAIVTCLLAPATVIGGIFGMNFDMIPYLHHPNGFYIAVGLMLLVPAWMLWQFKKRGWY